METLPYDEIINRIAEVVALRFADDVLEATAQLGRMEVLIDWRPVLDTVNAVHALSDESDEHILLKVLEQHGHSAESPCWVFGMRRPTKLDEPARTRFEVQAFVRRGGNGPGSCTWYGRDPTILEITELLEVDHCKHVSPFC
jgi:hypothetical protein